MFAAPLRGLLNRLLGRTGTTEIKRHAQAAIARGRQLAEAGDAANAAQFFQQALALDPDDAEAHFRLGLAWRAQQQLDAAKASYRRAIALRGDYIEAHNNLGSVLQMQGETAAALASYGTAVALKPSFGQPYLNLGRLYASHGDPAQAAQVFRTAIDRGIDVESFSHLLSALEGENTAAAPEGYTRELFDGFADDFDRHLVNDLGYRLPVILAARIKELQPQGDLRVLDLGCGTGLCGANLAGHFATLTGVDLSPGMLEKARARNLYDVLVEENITAWLRRAPAAGFDVVLAADVLIYLGELGTVFTAVARTLSAGGLFAFSIEEAADGDFKLQPSGRYAHAVTYIRQLCAGAGLLEIEAVEQHMRGGINGTVFVVRKI